jgi:signal transduction histidine kinase
VALHKERAAAEYRQALARILVEIERTSRLIENLMTLARADSGAEALDFVPMDLVESLREACCQGQTLAQTKTLAFRLQLPGKPVCVEADFQALRRLFLILIDNAVKYTPPGGQVAVSLRSVDGFAVAEVEDSGIGISSEDLPHIFERFYRADKARSRDLGGAGLGLSIARWIAQAHRGEIQVESVPGQGSNFRVRLPLADHL